MTDIDDTDLSLLDGPTLDEAKAAAALVAPEPDEDTDELPVDVNDGTIPQED